MKNSLAGITKDLGQTKKTTATKPTTTTAAKTGISVYNTTAGKGVTATAAKSSSGVVGASPGVTVFKPSVKAEKPIERLDIHDFAGLPDDAAKLSTILKLFNFQDEKKRQYNVHSLCYITEVYGLISTYGSAVLAKVIEIMTQPSPTTTSTLMEGTLQLVQALVTFHKKRMEPFLYQLFPSFISLHTDRSTSIRDTATAILNQIMEIFTSQAFRLLFPAIITNVSHEDWRVKVAALNCLKALSPRMSKQVSPLLPIIIPKVSDCVIDSKKQVQVAGVESLTLACNGITNDDIRPLVPRLVSVIAHPEESEATLNLLLETTFVVNVDSAVLALLTPLLMKVLRGRSSGLKRKACRVIDIMCRLVQNPADAAPFIPMLLPALDRTIDELTDPEVIGVAKAAREILVKAVGEERIAKIMAHKDLGLAPFGLSTSSSQNKLSSMNNSSSNLAGMLSANSSNTNLVSLDMSQISTEITDIETSGEEYQLETADPSFKVSVICVGVYQALLDTIRSNLSSLDMNSNEVLIVCDYIAQICANLVAYDAPPNPNIPTSSSASDTSSITSIDGNLWRYGLAMTSPEEWKECTEPFLDILLPAVLPASLREVVIPVVDKEDDESEANEIPKYIDQKPVNVEELAHAFRLAALQDVPDSIEEVDEGGSNLCNFGFSLAFGGKILLQNAFLRLGKGRRYGVMGKNGAGKTTLLTNIGTGNIEGLPPHLRTVYIQHDDASDDFGISIVDEMMSRKDVRDANVTRDDAVNALAAIGFTDIMLNSPRSALSGGWKMKLLIVRAMLCRADVILMDEPTNHLDAASVQWLIDNIKSQTETTCMIVSHDTAFLDAVITDVIHYENKKLVYYHGNLTEFVKIHPEAKYYYDLAGSTMQFKFPAPERLEGINSTTRAIVKIDNVTYTYPGASAPQLRNVSVKVCLGSRIAVVGANGAGKSTLIKLLVQETEPDKDERGEVWKHMNLRIAYVAQHSFHHVEQHLDVSPVDYIKWRFAGGVDKEEFQKPTMNTDIDDDGEPAAPVVKRYGDVDQIVGRRKNGRTMEYECTYIGQLSREPNKYIPVEKLIEMGLGKLVQQMDARVAAMAAGLDVRPLLTAEIQGHLDDFNLEAEFGTHGTIRRLSGGQKVKLVLAAAMWNRPHVLVLDEPTNYLDREALGALTQAIKNFGGGVVIISHNSEFTDALCTEKWLIKDGQCFTEGDVIEESKVKSSSKNSKKPAADPSAAGAPLKDDASGNLNATIQSEIILNPKTLEGLSKKETRKLEKLAQVAGVTLREYVSKINSKSPEWKWL